MCYRAQIVLRSKIEAYLRSVFGDRVAGFTPWRPPKELPYFLKDAFELAALSLLGHEIILASHRDDSDDKRTLKTQLGRLRVLTGIPVIYVANNLASYERRNLIEQRLPFLVPGNQLFLPDLGIDLREHFVHRPLKNTKFGPATQLLLIQALLRRPWEPPWTPSNEMYTTMTLSRAGRELKANGLIDLRKDGRTHQWLFSHGPRETWQLALPFLRSPVRRRLHVAYDKIESHWPLAGLSALAERTMLNESSWAVYATHSIPDLLPFPGALPGTVELQVWTYRADWHGNHIVDPLSLILSLRDDLDPRVQSAVEEIEEQLPW